MSANRENENTMKYTLRMVNGFKYLAYGNQLLFLI